MKSERITLAAVMAASAAFLVGCDNQNCKNAFGQPVSCRTPGAVHSGGGFFWGGANGGKSSGQADGVARGGFGGEGGGGHGGGGE